MQYNSTMVRLKLTQGKSTIISDKDYAKVKKYRWVAKKSRNTYYAMAKDEKGKTIYLHRLIKGVTNPSLIVDHKNHDGLNNTRSNLRVCEIHENSCNRGPMKKRSKNCSKYKGVYWSKNKERWIASITRNYKNIYIGSFTKELDAALAYDRKAKIVFGSFAYFNIS